MTILVAERVLSRLHVKKYSDIFGSSTNALFRVSKLPGALVPKTTCFSKKKIATTCHVDMKVSNRKKNTTKITAWLPSSAFDQDIITSKGNPCVDHPSRHQASSLDLDQDRGVETVI